MTATTTDLKELLARVEAAEKPSQELDALITCALLAPDTATVEQSRFNGRWCIYDGTDRSGRPRLWEKCPLQKDRQDLTASLDAALALVERMLPGAFWDFSNHHCLERRPMKVSLWPAQEGGCQQVEAPTLPLAIIAALLKALIAQESDHG